MSRASGTLRSLLPVTLLIFAVLQAGCTGDDGLPGPAGTAGADGSDGISCWDTNANGQGDPEEDTNSDGIVDVGDCGATVQAGAYQGEQLHEGYFTDHNYEGTQSCLDCHGFIGADNLTKAHFTWFGLSSNITGHETEFHGKRDLINNFCIAVPSNEGRCTQCHAGFGYDDNTFDFDDPRNVDCLVCHDQTGAYDKATTTAGLPVDGIDLNAVARSVAANEGKPTRKNCIGCHAKAGGGDNVKHGDLALSLANTTREYDVHMGTDGANYSCIECHGVKKVGDAVLDHGIGGMPYHSVDEGVLKTCSGPCHADAASTHAGTTAATMVNLHDTLACQVCHIPAIARETSTKVEWYWKDAGQTIAEEDIPRDPVDNRAMYDKKKGSFVWARNVRPSLLYFDGMWNRMMINTNEQYTQTPVVLAEPSADYTTPGAMIYPFKKMIGNQVADANNNTMLVPHLFGGKGGPNPYWGKFDWDLAIRDGAAYTGQTYSGAYEFVDTIMFLTVNHEVAPKEMALGRGNACDDCHTSGQPGEYLIDWQALGWTDDPLVRGGTRP